MSTTSPVWVAAESKTALVSAIAQDSVACELVTNDPDTWGFFRLSDNKVLVIGYADLGLLPVAVYCGNRLLVGVDEVLVSFDADTFLLKFSYRMPSVFHEFISIENPLVVRDEIGFICLNAEGEECWCFLTNGPVKSFAIEPGHIRGQTIDDEPFHIAVPT